MAYICLSIILPSYIKKLTFPKVLVFLLFLWSSTLQGQFKPSDYLQKAEAVKTLNDGYQTINPCLSSDGNQIWFTKNNHPKSLGGSSDQDIWTAQRNSDGWSKPTNLLKGLNSEVNDLIIGQSMGQLIFSLYTNRTSGAPINEIRAYEVLEGEYVLDHVIAFPEIELKSQFFGFFVPEDESFLLISMNGEFSFGKEDIYVVLRTEKGWSEPIHTGARINTSGFEMSPFMSTDGKHMFFASEGHNSYGSADIFVSVRLDDTWQNWSKPQILGPNINSEKFEAYFTISNAQNEAYFVSNRDGHTGFLHSISYKPNEEVDMTVHPSASGFIRMEKLPAMNVRLNLIDENDKIIQSVTTNDEGYFNLQSFLPDRDYKIAIDDSIRQDLSTADIFLTNDLGEKMIFMNENELGLFGFKVLSGEKIEEVSKLENLASNGRVVDRPTTISGKVAMFGTLNEKLKLQVVDENSKIVEEILTDEDGYFQFSTNSSEKSYFLSVDAETQGLVDVYEIFLTNDNPDEDIIVTKTDRHLFEFRALSDGSEKGIERLVEHDKDMSKSFFDQYGFQPARINSALSGYLKSGKLPLISAEISLIDDQDKTVDRAITDEEGRFVFTESIPEGDYTLQLDSEQEASLGESEIFLAKNPQDIVFYLEDSRTGVFAFKKLAQQRPMTLYSLKSETESGYVVSDAPAKLRGKFEYKKLPKSGVRLKLMDEQENIIQITEVDENGNFEFEKYTVNENYFISVEDGEGLSDIYEIYLSGQQKNVLVNRTNKYVFAFSVLPSQAIMLSKSYENDAPLGFQSRLADDGEIDELKGYFEYDLNDFNGGHFSVLDAFVASFNSGVAAKLRISNGAIQNGKFIAESIEASELAPILNYLKVAGVSQPHLRIDLSASDQVILSN